MEELNLIKVIGSETKISGLNDKLNVSTRNGELDNQLIAMHNGIQHSEDGDNEPVLSLDEKISLLQKASSDPLFLADMADIIQ